MDVMLRCTVVDRPGSLAALAGAISRAGGDIESVEVADHDGERATDDLVVVLPRGSVRALVEEIEAVDGVRVVHAAPSRGRPGDMATRFAVTVQAVLSGAMTPDRGLRTLAGGLLHATRAEVVARASAPREHERLLHVPLAGDVLVLEREYPFTPGERQRALALARLYEEVGRHVGASSRSG